MLSLVTVYTSLIKFMCNSFDLWIKLVYHEKRTLIWLYCNGIPCLKLGSRFYCNTPFSGGRSWKYWYYNLLVSNIILIFDLYIWSLHGISTKVEKLQALWLVHVYISHYSLLLSPSKLLLLVFMSRYPKREWTTLWTRDRGY